MKVRSLLVRQVAIYRPVVLPFAMLITERGTEEFRKMLGFREVNIDATVPEITFQSGLIFLDGPEARPTVINYVQFNPQRMIVEVIGDTPTASSVRENIMVLLASLRGGSGNDTESLLISHETVCVTQLDFDWSALLSGGVNDFISRETTAGISMPNGSARLAGVNLRFVFQFDGADTYLREQGLVLMDKIVAIEPSQNTSLLDRMYYTNSPMDSDSHIVWLSKLEQKLAPQQPSHKRKRLT